MPHADSREQLLEKLTRSLRQVETAHRPPASQRAGISTGIAALDALLPDRGISPGTLIETLADGPGSGAGWLAMKIAGQLLSGGGILVVVDPQREFYPPAAVELGINLANLIVVRPRTPADAIWSLEQSLRCTGVSGVLCAIDRLPDRVFRRLQLAAETGGGCGLLLRPPAVRGTPSWAALRFLVRALPGDPLISPPRSRGLRIELLHCRGRTSGGAVELEINDETGDVYLAAPVAAPAALHHAARA